MSRLGVAALLALSAGLAAPGAGLAKPAAVLGLDGPPQPSPIAPQLPASPGAGWSCSHSRCSYVKTSGAAWGSCFTAYTPTHNAWRPVRFCH